MMQLPHELEDKILSLFPTKSLGRFRSVCKRWKTLFDERRFFTSDLGPARPQFILIDGSKICSVDVNLDDDPSIEVHNLPSDIPSSELLFMTLEYCDGLLLYATTNGIGICNPWLKQIKWISSKIHSRYNGMVYDNSRPEENRYKIFESYHTTEFGSDVWKPIEVASMDLDMSTYSVSLNGALYWFAIDRVSYEQFIQSFDFSTERFGRYCTLPSDKVGPIGSKSLAVYRGDRFSFFEQDYDTRNIEIWVTKVKIKNEDGEAVEWMKLMNVFVPKWSSLKVGTDYPPSYFVHEDKPLITLVWCCNACIYIAKGDKFHEIKINDFVDSLPLHRTYFPSLVQVPTFKTINKDKTQQAGSRFALPMGVEASQGVGGDEWDDGLFDNVKRINVGVNDYGPVKFGYSQKNMTVFGAGHGNETTYIPEQEFVIRYGDYIEAVEGTYTESHITSIAFRMHKGHLGKIFGRFNGRSFVLGGLKGLKIVGFYGKSSGDHLTALGVHLFDSSKFYLAQMDIY